MMSTSCLCPFYRRTATERYATITFIRVPRKLPSVRLKFGIFRISPICAAIANKYQLSLIDAHDGIVLSTELDDHCDKLAVDCRSSEVLLTDDGPIYHALSVHFSRAKLIIRFDDRYAVATFSMSTVWSEVSAGSILIFRGTRISLNPV